MRPANGSEHVTMVARPIELAESVVSTTSARRENRFSGILRTSWRSINNKRKEVAKMSDDSARSTRKGVIVEKTIYTTPYPIGGKAIAGALARTQYGPSNHSDELQSIRSPAAWQQWGDWDNGHADS